MTEMRFDGQVAVVTGAGGNPGLGRAHAMLLASRGAKVVVNDLGVGPDGRSVLPSDPRAVVSEITAAGGEAIADLHSVADEAGARAVIRTALDAWGRVDVLVNNAGIGVVSGFDEIESTHLERVIGVHLMGSIWMCRAVWPHMREAGYGRIVNTTSGGMWGMHGLTVYGTAKFGVYGLTRGLALEGGPYGIRVNAVSPGGVTNSFHYFYTIHDPDVLKAFMGHQPAELVSPMVAFLAHRSCELTGAVRLVRRNGYGPVVRDDPRLLEPRAHGRGRAGPSGRDPRRQPAGDCHRSARPGGDGERRGRKDPGAQALPAALTQHGDTGRGKGCE